MRILGLLMLALLFAGTPFFLLNSLAMPQLLQVQQSYERADDIATQVALP